MAAQAQAQARRAPALRRNATSPGLRTMPPPRLDGLLPASRRQAGALVIRDLRVAERVDVDGTDAHLARRHDVRVVRAFGRRGVDCSGGHALHRADLVHVALDTPFLLFLRDLLAGVL